MSFSTLKTYGLSRLWISAHIAPTTTFPLFMIFTLEDHPRFVFVTGFITCYFLGLVIAPNVKRKEEWTYKNIENIWLDLGLHP